MKGQSARNRSRKVLHREIGELIWIPDIEIFNLPGLVPAVDTQLAQFDDKEVAVLVTKAAVRQ